MAIKDNENRFFVPDSFALLKVHRSLRDEILTKYLNGPLPERRDEARHDAFRLGVLTTIGVLGELERHGHKSLVSEHQKSAVKAIAAVLDNNNYESLKRYINGEVTLADMADNQNLGASLRGLRESM